MLRRLFTVLSALSLLLCVAVCVLWVRSYWAHDLITRIAPSRDGYLRLATSRGSFAFEYARFSSPGPWPGKASYDREAFKPRDLYSWPQFFPLSTRWGVPGLRYLSWTSEWDNGSGHYRYLLVRHWLAALVSALLPLRWFWLRRACRLRAWRERRCLCPSCGYDLRATPGRCPECGAVASAQPDQ